MSIDSPLIYQGNIITTRVRIARNVWGLGFNVKNQKELIGLIQKTEHALSPIDSFRLYKLADLNQTALSAMKERLLISQKLIDNQDLSAVLISQDQSLSIMLNEEDLIREQCFMKGLRVFEAYKKLDRVDTELSKRLNFAFDSDIGYLTACPTNVGTGLRASVMMFLPALTLSGKIERLCERALKLGITVRGAYGEGSKAEGYIYQISNEVTLGQKEQEILQTVEDLTVEICMEERQEIERLLKQSELRLMDKAKKSYGYLTNAIMLDYMEFLTHIGNVKLGAMLGMLNIDDIDIIDQLIVSVRPAILSAELGKRVSSQRVEITRANIVRSELQSIKE